MSGPVRTRRANDDEHSVNAYEHGNARPDEFLLAWIELIASCLHRRSLSIVEAGARACSPLRWRAGPRPRLTAQTGLALTAEREERRRTPVLVLDEAHLLDYEQLEAIRMLTNTAMDQDSPLSCLLVGRPTLRRTMKLAVLAALEQRTALRYTMPGMAATETASYIKHHLVLAGRADQLFTEDAIALVHTTARGFPRAVNNLCLQALVATFATGKSLVDEKAAQSAVTEVLD
ncbi:ExeA family protein [Streptomyces sp. NPDC051286]|uniref:ExeA family protein n=1 Tax=Streptomyces sp. NPDC051286 TaxID=3365647 RepID=UPI0037B46AC1